MTKDYEEFTPFTNEDTPVQIAPDPLVVQPVAPAVEVVVPVEPVVVADAGSKTVTVKLLTKQRNGTLVFYNVEDVRDVRNVDKEGKKTELKYSSRPQKIDEVIWQAFPFATADNIIEHLKLIGS